MFKPIVFSLVILFGLNNFLSGQSLEYSSMTKPSCEEIFFPTRNIDYPPDMVIGDTILFPNSNFVVYPGQCAYDTMSEVVHLNEIFIPGGYKGYEYWALYTSIPDGRIKNENLLLACSHDGQHYDTALCPMPLYTYQDFFFNNGLDVAAYLSDPSLTFDSVNCCLHIGFRASHPGYGPGVDSTHVYVAQDTSNTDTIKFAAIPILQTDCDVLSPSLVDSKMFTIWPDSGYNMLIHEVVQGVWQYNSRCAMVSGGRIAPSTVDTMGAGWDSLVPWHVVVRPAGDILLAMIVFRCYSGGLGDFVYAKKYLYMSRDDGHTWEVAPKAVHSASGKPVCVDSSGVYRGDFIPIIKEEVITLNCLLNGIRGLKWGAVRSSIKIPRYLPGDVNGDGFVDIGDAIYMLNYIFRDGLSPAFLNSLDVNGDCQLDVGDPVYLICHIFRSGSKSMLGCSPN